MTNPDTTLARLASRQHGVLCRSQALASGLTQDHLDSRLRSGLLIREHDGVYRHSAWPSTPSGRLLAAVLAAGRGAVASHRSAAGLLDFSRVPRSRPEVTVPTLDTAVRRGVLVHRTDRLDPPDVTVVHGVPCTSAARTALDLFGVLPYDLVAPAVEDAVVRGLVAHTQLVTVLERVGKRGRRGTAGLRALLRSATPDERLESILEQRLLVLLPPGAVLQHEITCADGREVRFDFAWPDRRVAIEANGRRWHATRADFRRDMERRRSIQATGWTHYEYGWADVTEHPVQVRAECAAALSTSVGYHGATT